MQHIVRRADSTVSCADAGQVLYPGSALQPLCAAIDTFLNSNRSKQRAAELEGVLIEKYIDREFFDKLSEPLALYSPGSGRPYVDEAELVGMLESFREEHCDGV